MSNLNKILITGATGFLGSHLLEIIDYNLYQVFCLVRPSAKKDFITKFPITIINGDVLAATKDCAPFDFDYIIHAAGFMSSNSADDEKLLQINIEGTKEIIKLAERKNVKRLVHISSVVAIGCNLNSMDPILNEESENITVGLKFSNYDAKRLAEEEVLRATREGKIRSVILNPSLMYGARDALKSVRQSNIKAASGKLPFYPEGGVNIVSVQDVAKTILIALSEGRNGERYILSGENITTKDLLSRFSLLNNKKAPSVKLPLKKMKIIANLLALLKVKGQLNLQNIFIGTSYHWYSNDKAKSELHFSTTPIQDAIGKSFNFMKENQLI
jgi:dihydroflavonol-4-reductase